MSSTPATSKRPQGASSLFLAATGIAFMAAYLSESPPDLSKGHELAFSNPEGFGIAGPPSYSDGATGAIAAKESGAGTVGLSRVEYTPVT